MATAHEPIKQAEYISATSDHTPSVAKSSRFSNRSLSVKRPFCIFASPRPGHGSLRGQSRCRNIRPGPERRHCKVHNGLPLDHAPIGSPRNCPPLALGRSPGDPIATLLSAAEPSGTARQIARYCAELPTAFAPRPPEPCLNRPVARSLGPNPLGVAIASHDGESQPPPRT